jgi:hypothetical protein
MAWRKWIVRSVVYGIIGAWALGGLLYQRWTNPVAVRAQVLDKLGKIFPGALVSVDSAHLRLLGGIELNDLRLLRRDDPEHLEFLHVPRATIYHDKEKITEGELAIRQVDLHNLRLRVRRERDGKWNVQGLTGLIDLTKLLPTIVLKDSTLVLEDYLGGTRAPPLEINDISLTLINDPLPTVSVRGAAHAEQLGKLHWQGEWHRPSGAVVMRFQVAELPLTQALLQRGAGSAQSQALSGLVLEARADLQGQFSFRPGQPLTYEVQCQVRGGKVQHPQLPLPLEGLTAALSCINGEVRLEQLRAHLGAAELSLSGVSRLPALDQDFTACLDLKHLTLCEELCARMPEKLRNLHGVFKAHGPSTVHVACRRSGGEWVPLESGQPSVVSLRPEGMAMTFVKFPYPLAQLTGTVDFNLLNRHIHVDLNGLAGERPVLIQGHWRGEGTQADASFDIRASDVVIDDKLLDALSVLPPATQKLAHSFHAQGQLDVMAHIRHKPSDKEWCNDYHLRFHEAQVCWDDFPYPLEEVTGVLDIYPGGRWEFHEFRGSHRGGNVIVNGRGSPRPHPTTGEKNYAIQIEIGGQNVAMDEELRHALRPMRSLSQACDTFRPSGRLTFSAAIDRPSPDPDDLRVDLVLPADQPGCSVSPHFFSYLLDDITGEFRYFNRRLQVHNVKARHKTTILALERGTIDLHGGGHHSDLQLQALELQLDDELARALPPKMQDIVRALKLKGPIQLQTRLVVYQAPEPARPPIVFWDGQTWLNDAQLSAGVELKGVRGRLHCIGLHNGYQLEGLQGKALLQQVTAFQQPFTEVQAGFEIPKATPDRMHVTLHAPIFGGDVTGDMRVDLNSTVGYELNLTGSQIDLQQFGKHNLGAAQLQGMAVARLYLEGRGAGLDGIKGELSLDVPNGRLGKDLPLLLTLIQLLGLHWPDRTAFEEMHAKCSINGRRVSIGQLDLFGPTVSLLGKGEFNFNGTEATDVHIDFAPLWGRLEQMLPPAVRPLPPAVSKNLLTIEVRGKVNGNPNDLRFHKKIVPVVLDPLTVLRDRVMGAEKKN